MSTENRDIWNPSRGEDYGTSAGVAQDAPTEPGKDAEPGVSSTPTSSDPTSARDLPSADEGQDSGRQG